MITTTGRPIAGILQLVLSTWVLSGLDASGKWIMGLGVSLLVLSAVRYIVHCLLVLAFVLPARGPGILRSHRPGRQVLRATFMLGSTLSMFTALHHLPQAQATSINFLAPLLVLALAPWLLGEPARLSRWVAAIAGFIGVLIVIRPGAGLDLTGTLFGLLTATLITGQYISNRLLAQDDPLTTLLWSGAVGSLVLLVGLPFALPDALPALAALGPTGWAILLGTGVWGALGHWLQIRAYHNASASVLSPFLYLQIISATALGWLIWGQFPDQFTWLGIAIIAFSGLTISYVEWRQRGRRPLVRVPSQV
ncbi:DMT family transporter [Castellaniella sp. MT123]|uniref:DMT family transporter n=1 Tax=Castellaniella sp. MT123 TaxID=3140381 RepID=UPI0031F3E13E